VAAERPVDVDETTDTVVVPPTEATPHESDEQRARRWYRRPALFALYAFLFYLLLSIVLWGLPIGMQLASRHVGMGGNDLRLYMWSFEWVPYAVSHGVDPFHTDLVYAPGGADLTWVTIMPGPALLLWPVTAAFGSLASVNLAMLLAPALAAWAGFLVCRRVTGSFWPSLAGGQLVGFTSYMAGQMYGHVNLVLIFPAILGVYLVVRRAQGSLGRWTFIGSFALTVVGLFSISTELVATASLFGAIALLGAWAFGGEARGRILRTGLETIAAYLLAAAVLSPILLPAIREAPESPVRFANKASVDLLSFVVPRRSILLGGERYATTTGDFTSNASEDGAYLGIVVIAMLVAFAIARWRHRETWLLLAFVAFVGLLALGPVLHIGGIERVGLPGAVLTNAPLLEHATPQRFSAYLWLPVGVIAAIWLASAHGPWAWPRWVVAAVAAITLLPLVNAPPRGKEVIVPRFFTDGKFAEHLEPGEIVFPIPTVKGDEMVWQAVADFRFRMAQGYIGPIPEPYFGEGLSKGLALFHPAPYSPPPAVVDKYVQLHQVSAFVSSDRATPEFADLLRKAGWRPERVEDVVIWRPAEPAG
jgi:hypothetical protein